MSARRPPAEITRAINRLRTEEQIPVASIVGQPIELAGVVYTPAFLTLWRWGSEGKGGVYLDVMKERRTGVLVTSRAALARFAQEIEQAATAAKGEPGPSG